MASGSIEPRHLSASTNGRPIKVAATGTPGTLLHVSVSGTDFMDLVTLYAVNTSVTSTVSLTIELGGTTDPDDHVDVALAPQEGGVLVVDGHRLNNGLGVRAFADLADVVTIFGAVDRIEL